MQSTVLVFLSLFALVLYSSCGGDAPQEATEPELTLSDAQRQEGMRLLQQNCITCHSPKGGAENRAAPPLFAVKRHYLDATSSKAEFVSSMRTFVKHPKEELSKMPGALKRFGLMPQLNFSEEQLTAVAQVIYETDMDEPDWFKAHYEENAALHAEVNPLAQGRNHAMATKAVLGKNLMQAIQTKGTVGAMGFCNERAYPLTDSMAKHLGVYIKRVSDKNRNPKNAPNAQELAYIQQAKAALSKGEEVQAQIQEIEGGYLGYYPIMSDKRCLQCHGKEGEQIKAETQKILATLYPEDKATGYGAGELRGIWVVEMPAKE